MASPSEVSAEWAMASKASAFPHRASQVGVPAVTGFRAQHERHRRRRREDQRLRRPRDKLSRQRSRGLFVRRRRGRDGHRTYQSGPGVVGVSSNSFGVRGQSGAADLLPPVGGGPQFLKCAVQRSSDEGTGVRGDSAHKVGVRGRPSPAMASSGLVPISRRSGDQRKWPTWRRTIEWRSSAHERSRSMKNGSGI